jgi:hypothetical protein
MKQVNGTYSGQVIDYSIDAGTIPETKFMHPFAYTRHWP